MRKFTKALIGSNLPFGNERMLVRSGYARLDDSASESTGVEMTDGDSLGLSAANSGRLRYNKTTQRFEVSENTGPYTSIIAASTGGWQLVGNIVQLVDPTDTVAIGAAAMVGTEKVRIVGGLRVDDSAGNAAFLELDDGQNAAVSPADSGRVRYNETTDKLEYSQNGGSYLPVQFESVANTTELSALPDSALPDGTTVFVFSFLDFWTLDKLSGLAPDGATVVAAGAGNWVRCQYPHPIWRARTSWYVDNLGGSDENDGTIANPLKTVKEWSRRIGEKLGNGGTVTVNIVGDYPNIETISCYVDEYPEILIFRGERTTLHSGTVTGYTAPNPATNQDAQLVDAGVADWTPYVGKMLVLTGGANVDAFGPVAKNLGASTARITKLSNSGWWDSINPAVNDTYDIYSFNKITAEWIVDTVYGRTFFLDLEFEDASGNDTDLYIRSGAVFCAGCIFNGGKIFVNGWNGQFYGCYIASDYHFYAISGATEFGANVFASTNVWAGDGGNVTFDYMDNIFQGNRVDNPALEIRQGSTVRISGNLGFFDNSGAGVPITILDNSVANAYSTTGGTAYLWGKGNTNAYMLQVYSNGCLVISNPIGIATGATADTRIGGVNQTFATVNAGHINAGNLARVLVFA